MKKHLLYVFYYVYFTACMTFSAHADSFSEFGEAPAQKILIALGMGLVFAIITVMFMKSQLKSVRRQSAAQSYLKQGSFDLTHSNDRYLYSRVTKTPRPQNNKR